METRPFEKLACPRYSDPGLATVTSRFRLVTLHGAVRSSNVNWPPRDRTHSSLVLHPLLLSELDVGTSLGSLCSPPSPPSTYIFQSTISTDRRTKRLSNCVVHGMDTSARLAVRNGRDCGVRPSMTRSS